MRATGSERAKEELSGYKRPKLQIWACRMMTNGGNLIKTREQRPPRSGERARRNGYVYCTTAPTRLSGQ